MKTGAAAEAANATRVSLNEQAGKSIDDEFDGGLGELVGCVTGTWPIVHRRVTTDDHTHAHTMVVMME